MGEQLLDVKGLLQLIRAFWKVVLAFVVAALLAATAYDLWAPPRYKATSLVLLPSPATGGSGTSQGIDHYVATDARIATSAAVLVPAGHRVDPTMSLTSLQRDVSTSTNSTSVLEIVAVGTTPHRAEAIANAVAEQLVVFLGTAGSSANSAVVAGLRAQVSQLTTQMTDVKGQLATANQRLSADSATSAASRQDSLTVDRLISEQSSLSLQLNAVKSQIAQAQLQGSSATRGTEVVERASSALPPAPLSLVLPLLLAAIGGVAIGSVAVLVWHRKDRRLWSRDAVAEAVGAPVALSLAVPSRRSVRDWMDLLAEHRPTALEQWTMRRALREIGAAHGGASPLRVLAIVVDPGALGLVVHLAVAGAVSGLSTHLVVVADGQGAAPLRAACDRFDEHEPRPGLVVHDAEGVDGGEPGAQEPAETGADLAITLIAADQARSRVARSEQEGAVTVLAVSAGGASGEELARAAIATADAGNPAKYVVMANPVGNDHTVGRFSSAEIRTSPRPLHRPAGAAKATLGRAQ